MKKGIEINIGIYSKEEEQLKELNLEINSDCSLWEKRTFWNIDWAMVDRDEPKQTVFASGGDVFISDMLYRDFVKLFNEE